MGRYQLDASSSLFCSATTEQNNELLMKNHKTRTTGTAPFPEANMATFNNQNGGRGRGSDCRCGRVRGSGFGRGNYRGVQFKNTSGHKKWQDKSKMIKMIAMLWENGFVAGQAALKAESSKVAKHEKACVENQHLNRLVTENYVDGWDDPHLITLADLKCRGVTSTAINTFVRGLDITRSDGSMIRLEHLEHHVRDELNKPSPHTIVVLHPLKVVITNLEPSS
nr:glutamine--tRNA ligase-like [Tanacetum cinerariifolium]